MIHKKHVVNTHILCTLALLFYNSPVTHAFAPPTRIHVAVMTPSNYRGLCRFSRNNNNNNDDNSNNNIGVIDVEVIRGDDDGSSGDDVKISNSSEGGQRVRKRDMFRDMVKTLASLSLKDYKWRSDLFKKNEAERSEEEVLAIMRGDQASYLRPMDAGEGRKGPLGNAEENAVRWLREVFEAEAKRAQKMADGDGDVLRPIDSSDGPLADLEQRAVTFLRSITDSETERVVLKKIRPMDLEEGKRGPLGNAEARAMTTIKEFSDSERMRAAQSRLRGGKIVRPIDVPGPLGEFEKAILDIVTAERERARERLMSGKIVRPKDSRLSSPLGNAERDAVATVDKIRKEEEERLRNIRKSLEENRPMEKSRNTPLGILESVSVGLLRGPDLVMKVIGRVSELLSSEKLDESDQKLLSPGRSNDKGQEQEEKG